MAQKMERMQFYLNAELNEELDRLAARRGVSKAELIREGIKRVLREKVAVEDDPILGLVGLGRGGAGNVATEHDQYLAELKLRKGH